MVCAGASSVTIASIGDAATGAGGALQHAGRSSWSWSCLSRKLSLLCHAPSRGDWTESKNPFVLHFINFAVETAQKRLRLCGVDLM